MYYLLYQLKPTSKHKNFGTYGDTFACCWVNTTTEEDAILKAEVNFKNCKYKIIERTEVFKVDRDYFKDDVNALEYFDQALIDGEIYLFNNSPKYPVVLVQYIVEAIKNSEHLKQGEKAKLYLFIVNEYVTGVIDYYSHGFWENKIIIKVIDNIANNITYEEGFKIIKKVEKKPMSYDLCNELEKKYYDEAEEYGFSVVFGILE